MTSLFPVALLLFVSLALLSFEPVLQSLTFDLNLELQILTPVLTFLLLMLLSVFTLFMKLFPLPFAFSL